MAKVKGSKISSKLGFVRETYGEEKVTAFLRSLPLQDQEQLRILLNSGWYPIELYEQVMEAICDIVANGDEMIYEQMGRHSAEEILNGTYKAFRGKNPMALFDNMAPMHAMLNSPGRLEVISTGATQCRIKVFEPRSTLRICRVAKHFYERAAELSGGTAVSVSEPSCSGKGDAYCQFDISWQSQSAS